MRTMGAILLAISGVLAGLSKITEMRKREKLMRSVINALEILKNEISTSRTPIRDAVYIILRDKRLESFCSAVLEYGRDGDDRSFSEHWTSAVREELSALPADCIDSLISLSPVLGRYDSELQSEAIGRCLNEIESIYVQMRSGQRDREKLYLGLCGGIGVIAAIVLI